MICKSTKCINRNTDYCIKCKRNQPIYTDYFKAYEPTCPLGYTDCVLDPAYIKCYHQKWYESLYGTKTPEEAAKESCDITNDDCYDYEDK